MKKGINRILQIGLFTLVWCIFNESFRPVTMLIGLFLSFFTILFVNYYLLTKEYSVTYSISLFIVIRYIMQLFVQIYKSGISSLGKILHGNDETRIYVYHTKLTDELKIGLLANAITSTPGTVIIDKDGQELKILSLGELNESGVKAFEKILEGRK